MQPTLFLKVKDSLEFKLVFIVLLISHSIFWGEEQPPPSFPPEQTPWNVAEPSHAPICWVLPQALVSSGDSFRRNRANLALHSPAVSLFPSFLP